ncbi:MAG: hypothetical protein U0N35_05915 [Limosilactobacillus fermentum]|nr:hypothetical protein [Limosilactobacillus fermentum]
MMKLKQQYKKQLWEYTHATLIGLIVMAGLGIIQFLLIPLVAGNFASFTIKRLGSSITGGISTALSIAVFIMFVVNIIAPYPNFKEAIANGVSRWTNWLAHHLALITFLFIILLLDMGVSLVNGETVGVNTIVAVIIMTTTFGALGNVYGLLSMRGRLILTIGLIVGFFLFAWLLARLIILLSPEHVVMVLQSVNHPLVWDALGVIWVALMLAIDYGCSMRMQLRRD